MSVRSREAAGVAARHVSLARCFAWLTVLWLGLVFAGWLAPKVAPTLSDSSTVRWTSIVAAVVVMGAATWRYGRKFYLHVSSTPFSVALLGSLLAFTVLGTFVPQNGAPMDYVARYGSAFGAFVLMLGANDLFHTVWYTGFLALLATSLVLVPFRRAAWRPTMWGHLLCHVGTVVILIGGTIGHMFGSRGMLDLREGQSISEVSLTKNGSRTGAVQALGFSIRLEDFQRENYKTEHKLYLLRRDGDSFSALRSLEPKDAREWTPSGADGFDFRVANVYPDFYVQDDLREVAGGTGRPALQLTLEKTSEPLRLFAGDATRSIASLASDGAWLRFVWAEPKPDELLELAKVASAHHVLVRKTDAGEEETAVEIGASYPLAGGAWTARVLEYQPDFVIDTKSHKASSRSQEPNNPALRIALKKTGSDAESERWLFAKAPDFAHGDASDLTLVYKNEKQDGAAHRVLLVIGATRELVEFVDGKSTRRSPIADDAKSLAEFPIRGLRVFASADELRSPATRSDDWKNPVVELEVRGPKGIDRNFLGALEPEPILLPDEKTAIAFERRDGEAKAYRSRLTVVEDGRDVLTKTIEVNDPLTWRGYYFYQSSYREEDPSYSGIEVVRDPGFKTAFVGFGMIAFGLIFVYYLRPRFVHHGGGV